MDIPEHETVIEFPRRMMQFFPDDPADRDSWWRPWLDVIAATVARGVEIRRARIVSEPVGDYVLYEFDVTFTNVAAGEQVRWMPRREATDVARPGNDFWLLDERLVLVNHFSGDGDVAGFELRGDQPIVALCASAFEAVWARAVPHEEYKPQLRELRTDAGLTGRDLGRLMGCHSSKVSKIEHGRQMPTVTDIREWCAHCGAPAEAPDLIASMRAVDGMFVEWRRMERDGLRRAQEAVVPLWERTKRFRIYSSWVIPGPLQTRAYIAAILCALQERRGIVDDVAEAVQVRLDKQHVLYEGGHTFAVVLEESVLRNPIGGPDAMAVQLDHLITLSSLPALSLGIVPMGGDRAGGWPAESFFLFDDDQVSVELVSGHLRLTQPYEVRAHGELFAAMAKAAVYGHDARALIAAAINGLR